MAYVGLFVLDTLLLLAGFGVLLACGTLERSVPGALAAAGLAFLAGAASVLMVTITLMILGVPGGLPTVAVVSLVVAAAGLLFARRRDGLPRREPPPPRAGGAGARRFLRQRLRGITVDRWIVVAFAVAFGAFTVAMLSAAVVTPITAYDAWALWLRKALVLYHFGTAPAAFFASPDYTFTNPEYPLLLPLFEAVSFGRWGPSTPRPSTSSSGSCS